MCSSLFLGQCPEHNERNTQGRRRWFILSGPKYVATGFSLNQSIDFSHTDSQCLSLSGFSLFPMIESFPFPRLLFFLFFALLNKTIDCCKKYLRQNDEEEKFIQKCNEERRFK